MSKSNGQITLSAIDFLQLAEVKRVARVDLKEVDMQGVVYVCDLSTAQQQRMFGGQNSIRVYNDNSRDIAMPKDAAAKMILECMVTDGADGKTFEEAFAQTDERYISVPVDSLVYYRDLWKAELGNTKAVNDKIQDLPTVVTNLVAQYVNKLSGIGDDEEGPVGEKKSS